MPYFTLSPALMLLFSAPPAIKPGKADMRVQFSQMTFRQRIVVRIPRVADPHVARPGAPQRAVEWKEKKSEKCIPVNMIAAASISQVDSVDLLMSDGRRLRARFNSDCRNIDFYAGFYLRKTADGMVCAKRDVVRSRAGDSCRIKVFRQLAVKR